MPLPTRIECERALARVSHFEFTKYCWQRPDPFIEARDNPFQRDVCSKIDNAIRDYRRGKSTFICFTIPFGHGKSDLSSRYLPPHFLGEFPDAECLVVSHTAEKANEFGAFGRGLIQSREVVELYPKMLLSKSNHGVEEWGLEGHFGKAQFIGIGSGTAGKRGNLIVVDDFFGKREHAESETYREKVWQSFTDDIMTRRAPVTIVIMVVTPWHVDDPIGRIKRKMKDDPNFPRFEFVSYPAESSKYKTGWLFSERFSKEWYVSQKTILGNYGYQSLMQCDPIIKGGNFLRTDKIHIVDTSGHCETCGGHHEWPRDLRKKRGWDLASSVKQTNKEDPDWTVGALGGVVNIDSADPHLKIPVLYIEDIVRGQWEAVVRQRIIRDTAVADGPAVEVGIEAFGGYKDSYTELAQCLGGIRSVRQMNMPGDKQVKAGPLVPIFEAGNVYFKKAPWNDLVKKVLSDFPSGAHDDDVDAISVMYGMVSAAQIAFEAV